MSPERRLDAASGLDRKRISVLNARDIHERVDLVKMLREATDGRKRRFTHGTGFITDFGGADVPGITGEKLRSLASTGDFARTCNEALSRGGSIVL